MQRPQFVGARVKRREDPRLVTGEATYVDDIHLPGMAYLEMVRSPYAHARIKSIDTARAVAFPGVLAVFTGEDMRRLYNPMPADEQHPTSRLAPRPLLAVDKVLIAGEGVACVVAIDRYIARDARDLVDVEYEPLLAVIDAEQAMESGATLLHEEFDDNVALHFMIGSGDVEAAFSRADLVINQRMVNQRLVSNAMETRGVLAHYQSAADHLTVWSSTQSPHLLRSDLADILNVPEHKMRVIAPEVGGGFGPKGHTYVEEPLVAAASLRLGRPVKWIEDRQEHFVATTHGRAHVCYLEAAVKRNGTILGIRLRVVADVGAYLQAAGPVSPLITCLMQTGCYKIPAAQTEMFGIFTNKTSLAPYRGAGGPESAYYLERLMDLIARELNMDPTEIRRRNFIQPDQFPYTTTSHATYDSGNYEGALNLALEMLDYGTLRQEQERLRQEGRYIGVGFSTFVEMTGVGPSKMFSMGRVGAWESATVRVEPTGKVTVLTGSSAHGQGHETTFAQVVADEMGVPLEDVSVIHGDTDAVPYGLGTFGSRSMAVGGPAVYMSVQKIKEKVTRIAAHMVEAQPDDMVYDAGRIYVQGFPDRAVTLLDTVSAAYKAGNLPRGMEPGLTATSFFDPPNFTFPFGAHVCVAEVDADSGEVKLLRYIAVDDCGRVINPMIVDGQIQGGIAQGVGQALLEGAVYDENGQMLTGSFMDYPLPTSTELPMIEMGYTETLTSINPLGAKGIGEAGTIAAAPAVVNAVVDALSPLGVRHIDMPLWPQRVWRAIQEARG